MFKTLITNLLITMVKVIYCFNTRNKTINQSIYNTPTYPIIRQLSSVVNLQLCIIEIHLYQCMSIKLLIPIIIIITLEYE